MHPSPTINNAQPVNCYAAGTPTECPAERRAFARGVLIFFPYCAHRITSVVYNFPWQTATSENKSPAFGNDKGNFGMPWEATRSSSLPLKSQADIVSSDQLMHLPSVAAAAPGSEASCANDGQRPSGGQSIPLGFCPWGSATSDTFLEQD